MTISKNQEGNAVELTLSGNLDTTTAPQLEEEIRNISGDVTELAFDLAQLEYISSAGLRALLQAQKLMNKQGTMVVRHANETVMEVFEITGFSDMLTIED